MWPLLESMEAFCQALAKSNQKFSLNLNIGKDNFCFTDKELATSSWQMKKKKSPSQVRREAKRREERDKEVAVKVADKDIPSSKATVKVPEKKVTDEVSEIDVSFTKDAGDFAEKAKTEAENALLDNPRNVKCKETF